jgi:hypothetical protein
MNKIILSLLFFTALSGSNVISAPTKSHSALHVLWEGIRDSKPYLVEDALQNKVNLNVRFGPYNDTPLMMALRIYGRHLQDRIFYAPVQKSSPVRKIIMSFTAAFSITGILCFFQLPVKYSPVQQGLLFSSLYAGLLTFLTFPTSHAAPAKVVEILIRNDLNIATRNKEGLNALDILRSYYSYAYQLQDESWYKFLALLIFKSGKDNAHDAWGDIEEEIEKYRPHSPEN